MCDDFDETLPQLAKFIAELPAQLFGRGAQRQIGLRSNQIDDGFRLGQIDFSIEVSPLRKFAWPRRACARVQTCLQNPGGDESAAMTTNLHYIFAGVTGGCTMNREHGAVDNRATFDDRAQMLGV